MSLETITFFGSSLRQYLVALLFIVLGFAFGKVIYGLISRVVRNFTKKTKTRLDDLIIDLIDRPAVFLIALGGLYLGVEQLTLPIAVDRTVNNVVIVLFALNVAWVVINFIDAMIINYIVPYSARETGKLDVAAAKVFGRIFKIVAWLIVIIMIITNLGYDVSALLTGLGLGGLAFALAAQDLLGNLFGGFAVLTDRPFKIGDRIKWGEHDGFVRDIGFRTTRVETFGGTMLVVPNADLAKTTLENISKEPARRVVAKIGLVYGTPTKKVKLAEDILKDVFLKNPDLKDDSYVGFSDFGDFALIITAIYFIKDPSKLLDVKSTVNRQIKERFEKAGLDFAFPTQTIIVEKAKGK